MLSLPQRPGPYILALLLAVLAILTVWMVKVLEDPSIREAVRKKGSHSGTQPPAAAVDAELPLLPATETQPMDGELQAMHGEMIREETSAERELEILNELLVQSQRAIGAGSHGNNNDITRTLVGNTKEGIWLPRNSPRIRDGEILDRWGSPYWFHANAGNQIEIRSAGPDRQLFTGDDLILNGSPAGYGATPEHSANTQ